MLFYQFFRESFQEYVSLTTKHYKSLGGGGLGGFLVFCVHEYTTLQKGY